MKLLLTSNGLTNKSIVNALKEMAGEELRFAFIPTGANTVTEEKNWVLLNLLECSQLGETDIVDFSALPKEEWLPRMQWANVIVMEGGDTEHIIECAKASGFDKELSELLKDRVYVGISGGSIAMSKKISTAKRYISTENPNDAPAGFGYVEFDFRPHLNAKKFPKYTIEYFEPFLKKINGKTYLVDDDTALVVTDNKVHVVSEGTWKLVEGKK
ncbi:MAG: Type 1 glutamine amidotransferase-like domain-containing protein [Candidatus Woesearchaeota archaeon]